MLNSEKMVASIEKQALNEDPERFLLSWPNI